MAKLTVIFLFILSITPFITTQCIQRTAAPHFKKSIYEFTLNLARRINEETDSHFVTCALSPWTLLSAMSLGASENSLKELRDVLQLHPHMCFNHLYFEMVKQITSKPQNPTASVIERSSTIFLDGSLVVKRKFLEDIATIGICDARIVSFFDTRITAAIINEHVSNVTHEAIEEIVTPSDLEDMLIVMIDALYFKGLWKTPFPYEDTELSAFYDSKGKQIGDVQLMYVSARVNKVSMDLIKADVLELPYGDDSRYSMLLFLPYENVTVTTVIDSMQRITVSSIYILFNRRDPQSVDIQIPRFKISSDLNNLKELLMDMGLQTLFDSGAANFPGISDYQLSLTNFIQKADIEVTEDGTVASAATAAFFEARSFSDQFVANKPFLFMIVDRLLHIPIFSGAYSKPSNY